MRKQNRTRHDRFATTSLASQLGKLDMSKRPDPRLKGEVALGQLILAVEQMARGEKPLQRSH